MSKYRICIDGKTYEMEIERMDGTAKETKAAHAVPKQQEQVYPASPSAPAAAVRASVGGNGAVSSPMPGTVNKVFVSLGDTVKAGQAVLILEAMKMENEITAPRDGKVVALNASEGQSVQGGALLFEIGE